jgi:hypothetical protein
MSAWADTTLKPARADPLLIGATSPALERYRLARASLAELELERARGNLVPRAEIDTALARFAGKLRQAGETLTRDFAEGAAAVLNEAASEAVREWEQAMTPTDMSNADVHTGIAAPNGPAGPGAPAADDAPVRRGRNRRPKRPVRGT